MVLRSATLATFLAGLLLVLVYPGIVAAQSYGEGNYGADEYDGLGADSSSRSGRGSSSNASTTTVTTTASSSTVTLQNQLALLIAEVARLQALLGGNAATGTLPAGSIFTTDLTVGIETEDVRKLQKFLNGNGFMVGSAGGVGAPGNETTYFGELTREALARFQSARGITPAVGYFGPITRTLVNSLLK